MVPKSSWVKSNLSPYLLLNDFRIAQLTFTAANPLQNLVPVDEYIPIMFGQHFNHTWKQAFESNEKLTAWSAAPLILFPTRYTGEEGYISDTEESDLIQVESEPHIHSYYIHFDYPNLRYNFSNLQNAKKRKRATKRISSMRLRTRK